MIADRKLSFHNNLQHSVCFHVFIYPDTEGPWSGPDYPIDCNLGAPQGLGILLKILSNHYSSLFKERICNKLTSSYVTSKKYSTLVQVVYGVARLRGGAGWHNCVSLEATKGHNPALVVFVWLLDLQIPVQSVPITTKVVSSNHTQAMCTRYNIM